MLNQLNSYSEAPEIEFLHLHNHDSVMPLLVWHAPPRVIYIIVLVVHISILVEVIVVSLEAHTKLGGTKEPQHTLNLRAFQKSLNVT
jgi:hypothetical protein